MKSEKIQVPVQSRYLQYGEKYEFDEHDKLILKELDENARKPLSEMSAAIGLSRDAIRKRIEKMVNAKVILAFRPVLNPPAAGITALNYVFISILNLEENKENEFILYLKNHANIAHLASMTGKWDYMILIMAKDQGEFDTIWKGVRKRFPEMIKDYEIYSIIAEYKYDEVAQLIYGTPGMKR